MSTFTLSTSGGIARLTLTRPDVSNALCADFWRRFASELLALDSGGETRALILAGEGRNFCAGMDLAAFAADGITSTETPAQRESFQHAARYLQNALDTLDRIRFPVIAVVQGACVGAGLELLAACDMRFASIDAYFRIEEINIGMMADLGSLQRLPKLLPEPIVKDMAYCATTLSAERAAQLGFVNSVAETQGEALILAEKAAERIAGRAPLAIAGSKAAFRFGRDHSLADGLEWAAVMQSAIWSPKDIGAAVQARATKQAAKLVPLAPLRHIGG